MTLKHQNQTTIRAVIGSAGHVDHGKTTLIGALTGIQTDRLQEEQERGISIELGFAWMNLEDGQRVAMIDVPGHERFVRQMIAGAAGIDMVMLVIAADEGVMPQTREHLDICGLLGVDTGLIVVTKTDLVEDDWLELVLEDIASSLEDSFLDGAPIVCFSAMDPTGPGQVTEALIRLLDKKDREQRGAPRRDDRPFKMSVDRVFSVRGFGTVVTGTSTTGVVAVGDSVCVLPGEKRARVRGIQVHGEAVDFATPGMRIALNLQGLDHDEVSRGGVITHAEALDVVSMFDGTFKVLERVHDPLPNRSRVLIHLGTAQVEGTLSFLEDVDEVAPGDSVHVQVRLDRPVPLLPGEPFVARGFHVLDDYGKTVGGGRALTNAKRRHRRRDVGRHALVEALATGSVEDMLCAIVRFEGMEGCATTELPRRLPADKGAIAAAIRSGVEQRIVWDANGHLYHHDVLLELLERADVLLTEHHTQHPAWPGLDTQALRTKLMPNLSQAFFQVILNEGQRQQRFIQNGEVLALPEFQPTLDARQQVNCDIVLEALTAGGLTPMRVQDLIETITLDAKQLDDTIELLIMQERLVRVTIELVYARSVIDQLVTKVTAYLNTHETMDTAAFKELTGASRKWAIPLGEHLDRIKLTARVGNERRLRRSG